MSSSSTSDSFGEFVSVSSHPLNLLDDDDDLNAYNEHTETHHTHSDSFQFFEKFTQEAKRASDEKRKSLLNELVESTPVQIPRPNHRHHPRTPSGNSKFIASLLSSSRPAAPGTSPEHTRTLDTFFSPPHERADGPLRRQSSHPVLPSSVTTITHGTPFAPHAPEPPPTGAPGFTPDTAWDTKGFAAAPAPERAVTLVGRSEQTDLVLNVDLADQLRTHLPALSRLHCTWSLVYSLDQHGVSLSTLYARCTSFSSTRSRDKRSIGGTAVGGMLLAIRDTGGALFGAWVREGIRKERGAFYGSGESFLWSTHSDTYSTRVEENLRVYHWTGRNAYVALCEDEYISFGGGDGHYGLYLDSALCDGSSAGCPTFGNEPLCSGGAQAGSETVPFECVGLEVWAVG